ncbi:Glutamyl-Q tRNA(Asp) synthetase [Nymphon striatum]|nr:Glutamyl-Q tRNA(Asp) synthetase [Nymphon striatum]
MNVSPPVFRFAPSPNGALHLGHAYSALLNYQLARNYDGKFLVRVEDIDQTRCTPDLENAMLDDLSWLDVKWEEPVRRQSEHFDDYAKAVKLGHAIPMVHRFSLAKSMKPDHQGDDDNMVAIRLDMKAAIEAVGSELSWVDFIDGSEHFANAAQWGDIVLARRDTPTSYHLSVVVDDALQGVTHVVRGRDLLHATAIHILLQALVGLATTCLSSPRADFR